MLSDFIIKNGLVILGYGLPGFLFLFGLSYFVKFECYREVPRNIAEALQEKRVSKDSD